MIDLMLSRDLFLILTRVNEIKKRAQKGPFTSVIIYTLLTSWHLASD